MTTPRVRDEDTTLLDILDRLLDTGVVVAGDLMISVADVDLIFASVRLVVCSADKALDMGSRPSAGGAEGGLGGARARGPGPGPGGRLGGQAILSGGPGLTPGADPRGVPQAAPSFPRTESALPQNGHSYENGRPDPRRGDRLVALGPGRGDPAPTSEDAALGRDKGANGLARLVLGLAELLRKAMEREALRRMERGTVTAGEIERLGRAFLRMEQQMGELKEAFRLRDEDLRLGLGPLAKVT